MRLGIVVPANHRAALPVEQSGEGPLERGCHERLLFSRRERAQSVAATRVAAAPRAERAPARVRAGPRRRCGPYQTIWGDNELCVCEEGAAQTPTGCVPCGENEVVTPAGCACDMGFARASASEPCVPCGEHEVSSPNGCICEAGFSRAAPGEPCAELSSGGAGSACSSDAECLNPAYPHCQVRVTGTGYCTNEGCTDNAACAQGFTCVTSSSPSACLLPPEGAGRPCTGQPTVPAPRRSSATRS